MTEIIGLAVYVLGVIAMWKLRQRVNPETLHARAKGDASTLWAILFISSVLWPLTMPFMFIGWAQRKVWAPKDGRTVAPGEPKAIRERRRKPKSQRGRS